MGSRLARGAAMAGLMLAGFVLGAAVILGGIVIMVLTP
jgi:hypothetical protein